MRAARLDDVRSGARESQVALDGEAADGVPQLGTHQRQRELLAVVYLRRQQVRRRKGTCYPATSQAQVAKAWYLAARHQRQMAARRRRACHVGPAGEMMPEGVGAWGRGEWPSTNLPCAPYADRHKRLPAPPLDGKRDIVRDVAQSPERGEQRIHEAQNRQCMKSLS